VIRFDKINDIAIGLVGWRQSTKSGSVVVDAANLASRSGLIYQDGSGYVTVENIQDTMEDPDASDAQVNTYLGNLSKSGFIELLNVIFTEDDFIENRQLFAHENRWTETITNDSSFVGYEIKLEERQDITVVLNQIMLEFDAADTVKILLFNSQKNALVDSQEVTTVANTTTIQALDWELDQNGLYKGGDWYVGYLTSGLTAQAVNREYELSNLQTRYDSICIQPIKVDSWNAETLFDINDIEYTAEYYGLNFDISAYFDYTQLVLRNENRFAKGLQLQVAIRVLEVISNTTRTNRSERLSKANVIYELNGNKTNPDYPQSVGILTKLKREVERLKETYIKTSDLQIGQL
jgi:hypothetical protein